MQPMLQPIKPCDPDNKATQELGCGPTNSLLLARVHEEERNDTFLRLFLPHFLSRRPRGQPDPSAVFPFVTRLEEFVGSVQSESLTNPPDSPSLSPPQAHSKPSSFLCPAVSRGFHHCVSSSSSSVSVVALPSSRSSALHLATTFLPDPPTLSSGPRGPHFLGRQQRQK
ncbi:unnamed protein product [Linum trigynum]|uniref:Uncharacterized protein n=1 Tax=Linum trigynum TaxID=586398 RepID=A0AAV2ESM2_9ROSI